MRECLAAVSAHATFIKKEHIYTKRIFSRWQCVMQNEEEGWGYGDVGGVRRRTLGSPSSLAK